MTDNLSFHLAGDGTLERVEKARSMPGYEPGLQHPNIASLLHDRAAEHGAKSWLIFYDENGERVEISFGRFHGLVRRAAHLLETRGISRGDRVCIVAHNHPGTVAQCFAAWYVGAAVVPVNVGENDNRIAHIVEHSGARLAFVRSRYIERFRHIANAIPSLGMIIEAGTDVSGSFPSFHEELDRADPDFEPREPAIFSDDALIVYTSGTTGAPKGVVLDQGNLLSDACEIAVRHRIDQDQRMMCVLPLHHVNGIVVTLLTPMVAGSGVLLERKFSTGKFFERIEAEDVRVASVVPTLLQYLLHDAPDRRGYDLSRFRHVICGAGPLTCELAARFEQRFGIPVIHGYGLSETTCYSSFLPVDLARSEHDRWMQSYGFPSIGTPLPCNEMDIHGPGGVTMPAGERGEIVIRGANVMKYYFGDPGANTEAFAHGWFRSGDEGFFLNDEKGERYFFITGRIKELIIRGGVNIAPLEVDEVLNSCQGVKAGIAVGFENDWYGEEVGALVIRADPSITEQQVLSHCSSLPAPKRPKVVLFAEELPVTSTGKYQRGKVKHLFEQWKSVQFH